MCKTSISMVISPTRFTLIYKSRCTPGVASCYIQLIPLHSDNKIDAGYFMALILGIDPGSRRTGYGVINANGSRLEHITHGCIVLPEDELPERLRRIFDGLCLVIAQHCPQAVAVEQVFMSKNAGSALKLGQARGAAITAAVTSDLPVAEYSARQIKQAVVGTGAAQKEQVQHMVVALLKLSEPPQEDAADALATAICHAHSQQTLIKMSGARGVRRRRLR